MEGRRKNKKAVFFITVFITGCVFSYMSSVESFWENKKEQSNIAIEKTIRKSALECYALEGSFPPSIDYLKENYGLIVNEDKYFYHYQVNGSNILPDIKVIKRWGDE